MGIPEETPGFTVHSTRVTSGSNAWANGADLEHLRRWFGHKLVATTQRYIDRQPKLEDSPTSKITYGRAPVGL